MVSSVGRCQSISLPWRPDVPQYSAVLSFRRSYVNLIDKAQFFSALRRPHWFLRRPLNGRTAVHRLATSITQLTLCQVSAEEIDAATKLVDKVCQKLRGIPDAQPQRITDLENMTCQLRQLSCILDSCTISASYEVSQAQKTLLLMPRTAQGASTSSEHRCHYQLMKKSRIIKTNSRSISELPTDYDDWKRTSERTLRGI